MSLMRVPTRTVPPFGRSSAAAKGSPVIRQAIAWAAGAARPDERRVSNEVAEIGLLGQDKGVINLNAQVVDGALQLAVPE